MVTAWRPSIDCSRSRLGCARRPGRPTSLPHARAAGWEACGIWFDAATWNDAVASEVRRRLDDTGLIALDMEPVFVTPAGDHGEAVIEAAAVRRCTQPPGRVTRRRRRAVRRSLRRAVRPRRHARHRLQPRVHGLHVGARPPPGARRPRSREPTERGGPDRQPPPCPHRRHRRRRRRDLGAIDFPTSSCAMHRRKHPPTWSSRRSTVGSTPRRRPPPHRRTRRRAPASHGTVDGDPVSGAAIRLPRSGRPRPRGASHHAPPPPAMSERPDYWGLAHRWVRATGGRSSGSATSSDPAG